MWGNGTHFTRLHKKLLKWFNWGQASVAWRFKWSSYKKKKSAAYVYLKKNGRFRRWIGIWKKKKNVASVPDFNIFGIDSSIDYVTASGENGNGRVSLR